VLESFTAGSFEPRTGETFTPVIGEHRLETELAEVAVVGPGGDSGRAPFSLMFLAPPEPVWGQATYRVTNEILGAFELFLVPLGAENGRMRYQAIFT
jgi:hypothetical protein